MFIWRDDSFVDLKDALDQGIDSKAYSNLEAQLSNRVGLTIENLRTMAFVLPLFFILISFYDSYFWGHHTQALFAYLTAIFYRSDMYKVQEEVLHQ